jgi:hypothetical protein
MRGRLWASTYSTSTYVKSRSILRGVRTLCFFLTFGWNYSVEELVTKRQSIPVCTSLAESVLSGCTGSDCTVVHTCLCPACLGYSSWVGWGGGGYHCKNVV